jgi:hypothetical protein
LEALGYPKTHGSRELVCRASSWNHFISIAVAEKIAALEAENFFMERAKRADFDTFRALLTRPDGEPPRPGDEI